MPRRGLDREQVVSAAAELAAEHGLDAVTVSRVADRLGVRPPSLYNHIESREALLRELAVRGIDRLADRLAAAAVGRSGDDAVLAIGRAYRTFAHDEPGLYAAAQVAPPAGDTELQAAGARVIELLAAVLRGWALEGDDLVDTIRALRSGLHGFVTLERQGGFALPRDVDRSYERLLEALITGLRPAVSAPHG